MVSKKYLNLPCFLGVLVLCQYLGCSVHSSAVVQENSQRSIVFNLFFVVEQSQEALFSFIC